MANLALAEAPHVQHQCSRCGGTGLVPITEPAAPPAPIGGRAPTAQDALEWGAWLLKCRVCDCAEALSA